MDRDIFHYLRLLKALPSLDFENFQKTTPSITKDRKSEQDNHSAKEY